MNKLIFLDIDGVLNIMSRSYNSCAWVNLGMDAIEVHLMKRLEYIIDETDASIVLSSSWRLKAVIELLTKLGFKYVDKIKDTRTPKGLVRNLYNVSDERIIKLEDDWCHLKYRGDQIDYWLKENDFKGNYVVLEDEIIDVCGRLCNTISKDRVVEVDMNEGLSHRNVMKVIEILND